MHRLQGVIDVISELECPDVICLQVNVVSPACLQFVCAFRSMVA
jgi:hypothetical protein